MEKQIAEIEAYEVAGHKVPSHKIAFSDTNPEGKEVLVCVHSLITNSHDFDFIAKDISKYILYLMFYFITFLLSFLPAKFQTGAL